MPIRYIGTDASDSYDARGLNTWLEFYGRGGRDYVYGSDWGDYIDAGSGNDVVRTGNGHDTIRAGSGHDQLYLTAGDDDVDGGTGVDGVYFDYAQAGVRVDLEAGTVRALHSTYADRIGEKTLSNVENVGGTRWADGIVGNAEANWAWGGDGHDTFRMGDGDDFAWGGDGDDIFYVGAGDDLFNGGDGYDRLDLTDLTHGVVVDMHSQTLYSRPGAPAGQDIGLDDFTAIESFVLTAGADFVDATGATANHIYAWRGDDTVKIGRNDIADGVSGIDTLDLSGLGDGVRHDLGTGTSSIGKQKIASYDRFEIFVGGGSDDRFDATLVSDKTIRSGAGKDDIVVFGGTGNVVEGQVDADVLSLIQASGRFDGGAGDDELMVSDSYGPITLLGGSGTDTLALQLARPWAVSGVDLDVEAVRVATMDGTELEDLTFSGFEIYAGSAAADRLAGSSRSETIRGEGADDFLFGRGGADRIEGGAGDDVVSGGGGDDILLDFFGTGSDSVNGGAGRDVILYGGGDDHLLGGADSDTFLLREIGDRGFGNDRIADFDNGSPASGGDVLNFETTPGLQVRRLDGALIRNFADLDTNGDGRIASGDLGVSLDGDALHLRFAESSLSIDGLTELTARSVTFDVFDL